MRINRFVLGARERPLPERPSKPREDVVERIPEDLERRQRLRELMPEHVVPFGLDLLSKRGGTNGRRRRYCDSSKRALRREDRPHRFGYSD
jgi:hypothetical protein